MEYVVIHMRTNGLGIHEVQDVYGPFANRQEAEEYSASECPADRRAGEYDVLEPIHRRVRKIVKYEWVDPEDAEIPF